MAALLRGGMVLVIPSLVGTEKGPCAGQLHTEWRGPHSSPAQTLRADLSRAGTTTGCESSVSTELAGYPGNKEVTPCIIRVSDVGTNLCGSPMGDLWGVQKDA